jgi:hypothetical protein
MGSHRDDSSEGSAFETTRAPQKDGVMVKNSGPLPERVNCARIQGGLGEGRKG